MKFEAHTYATPVGPLAVAVTPDGAVAVARFAAELGAPAGIEVVERASLGALDATIATYLAGDVHAIDAVMVEQSGGPFTTRAWEELRRVPAGETITYGELARRAGNPKAVRAAGQACARNRVALFVPCHRVIDAAGDLHHYAYGVGIKGWLLAHERGDSGAS